MFTLAALTGALVVATGTAQAGYSFVTTPTPTTTPFTNPTPPNSILSLTGTSGGLPGQTLNGAGFANISDVALSSTSPPSATDTATIPISIAVAITNAPSPGTNGTGTITVTGSITFTRSDTGNEISFFTLGSILNNGANIGNVNYTLSNVSYTPPTVNVGTTNISALITPTPSGIVPEPASMVMLGSGLVGVIGLALRRAKKS